MGDKETGIGRTINQIRIVIGAFQRPQIGRIGNHRHLLTKKRKIEKKTPDFLFSAPTQTSDKNYNKVISNPK